MSGSEIVSRDDWLKARKDLLDREKAFTRQRDELAAARRALPKVRVDKDYRFQTAGGEATLADLFGPHSQLIVYHFMYGPDWETGCKSCSFWADNYDGISAHLAARDVALVAISNAPLQTLLDYREANNWSFDWVSAGGTTFSADFGVTFNGDDGDNPEGYNYTGRAGNGELPGISVFEKQADGSVLHTYSVYARGLEDVNGTYRLLDIVPKGRDEDGLDYPMAWVRRRDQYGR